MTTPASTQDEADGRRVRGHRRRAELIAATLRVVERDGAAGVTHRSVAREAGVPASSAVYYFATLDDLLVAALSAAADDYARQLRDLVDSGRNEIDGLAEIIADAGGDGLQRALAEHELTILAVRRPALRPLARHWRDQVAAVAGRHTDDPGLIEATVAVADGICAQVMLGEERYSAAQIAELLRRTLRLT